MDIVKEPLEDEIEEDWLHFKKHHEVSELSLSEIFRAAHCYGQDAGMLRMIRKQKKENEN